MKRAAVVFLAAASLASCITTVDVRKVTPGAQPAPPGIPYFLPAPFLKVTPAGDGSLAVDIVYLPDPNHEYAAQARSVLAKYKLVLQLDENQLLKKVDWSGTSSDVAKQAVDSGAQVAKAKIEANATAKKAADDKKAAAAKERKNAIAAAKTALGEAELQLTTARQRRDFLVAPGSGASPADKQAAELGLLDAQAARDAAAKKLAELEGDSSAATLAALADKPVKGVPGPLLFRIVDDGQTVRLVPVSFVDNAPATKPTPTPVIQGSFPSSSAETGEKATPIKLYVQGAGKVGAATKGVLSFHVVSNVQMDKVAPGALADRKSNKPAQDASGKALSLREEDIILNSATEFVVTLPKGIPDGSYDVNFGVTRAGAKSSEKPIKVVIEVAR